ncbi:acyl-CoA dehydrogenase [Flaviflexus salsibiostraticola]|uniref:acyl-CoA oxidase n=1 Tax=Flaviflexus salsibiostraticola TaxID=1282737 RepID=A0A3Q8WU42_9ACTO|nr:acyl-CoA dehydrogenase [Flaviflexus salsibiostraticola]AZN30348.1 acyl-CoA dehydrogenase [Flaviflexus salsibiostraticola]
MTTTIPPVPSGETSDGADLAANSAGPIAADHVNASPAESHLHVDDIHHIDVPGLTQILDGRWAHMRAWGREISADPAFARPIDMPREEHRELTLARLKELAKRNWSAQMLPGSLGGMNDPGGNLAAFEELVASDPSLQIKAGVQFGLFASAILHLGTEEHHSRWLAKTMSLEIPGIYAMTEIGHGSDVSAVGTTAVYDEEAEEFVITTPFRAATKEYLGNAALHGHAAVVFAQLITRGVNHGVHCFFVPIREDGKVLPGITIEDDGEKGGLNGIDNGRIAFDHVRVPRTNLLNRYGDVAADGTYSSPIPSPGRRFFTMLTTLVQGRVSLSGAAISAAELALGIAITYGSQRRQFADFTGVNEVVLLDYQLHQHRLFPLLARTYAAAFAQEDLLHAYHEVFSGEGDTDENREDLETMAAALKPNSTWLALETIQTAREACGGAGYMAENRLVGLHDDLDVYATFEGDNHVLLQLVGKRLLGEYAKSLKGMDAGDVTKFIASRAEAFSTRHTPWRRLLQSAADLGSVRRTAASLRDPELQLELLSTRAESMVEELSLNLRQAPNMPKEDAAALVNSHQLELIEAAKAHVDLILLTAFNQGLEKIGDDATKAVLVRLRDLFALTTIEENLSWYVINGHLSLGRARTLRDYINRLLTKIRPHALDLVAAFGYTQEHWRAPISSGLEAERQAQAAEYYRRHRASNEAPIDEKILYKRDLAEKAASRAD